MDQGSLQPMQRLNKLLLLLNGQDIQPLMLMLMHNRAKLAGNLMARIRQLD